jgi:hypothetical protein
MIRANDAKRIAIPSYDAIVLAFLVKYDILLTVKENKSIKARKGMILNLSGKWLKVEAISWDGVECSDLNAKDILVTREEMKTVTLWNWNAA